MVVTLTSRSQTSLNGARGTVLACPVGAQNVRNRTGLGRDA
jgi:hypothetical protein